MIRVMKAADYEQVYALWKKIRGFGIRSIDDSREGVERFLKRNPNTSIVAEIDGKIVEVSCAAMMEDGDASIMSVWMRLTGDTASENPWW